MTENEPDRLMIYKDGDELHIEGIVDDETVFWANPTAKRSNPVVTAALRTWGRRAFPELAADADGVREENGGAFQ